jgi:hypothetical protein
MLVPLAAGNVGSVLLLGGKSTWVLLDKVAVLVVNVGLNLLLIPRFGILGAAMAWAVSIVVDNVLAVLQVHRGLRVSSRGPGMVHAMVLSAAVRRCRRLVRILLGPPRRPRRGGPRRRRDLPASPAQPQGPCSVLGDALRLAARPGRVMVVIRTCPGRRHADVTQRQRSLVRRLRSAIGTRSSTPSWSKEPNCHEHFACAWAGRRRLRPLPHRSPQRSDLEAHCDYLAPVLTMNGDGAKASPPRARGERLTIAPRSSCHQAVHEDVPDKAEMYRRYGITHVFKGDDWKNTPKGDRVGHLPHLGIELVCPTPCTHRAHAVAGHRRRRPRRTAQLLTGTPATVRPVPADAED